MRIIDINDITSRLPVIPEAANKFTRGRLLLVTGSYGMAGAAVMAVRAALRTGAGYTDLAIPESLYSAVAAAVPESVITLYDEKDPEGLKEILGTAAEKADAVVLGCGLGKLRETVVPTVLSVCRKPLVLDADGLNALSSYTEKPELPENTVLTPHEGEMARLLKTDSKTVHADREGSLGKAAEMYHASVLLKGPRTLVTDAGRTEIYVNTTGNPGMARAGSGDVLSGIIGAFSAQGMEICDAAMCGVYLHGLAGDIAARRFGIRSMLPTDLIECIPEALREIENRQ